MTLYRIRHQDDDSRHLDVEVLNGTTAEALLGPDDRRRVTGLGLDSLLRSAAEHVWSPIYSDEGAARADGRDPGGVYLWDDFAVDKRRTVTNRSGAKWSEDDYSAAGWSRINARVSEETKYALEAICSRRGESQSQVLSELIREALESELEQAAEAE